jgi:hypothetical protein
MLVNYLDIDPFLVGRDGLGVKQQRIGYFYGVGAMSRKTARIVNRQNS